jgi:hypothetical protein
MRGILLLLALIAVFAAAPAFAGDAPAGKGEGPAGTNVEMPFLIAPIAVNGKLMNYAYISSKLVASSQSAAIHIRDKLAFIQDAFVRDVNAVPIGKPDDPASVDTAALAARLVADARRIVGSDQVANLIFTQIQMSPLHPSPTTEAAIPPSERAADSTTAAPAAATTTPTAPPKP